MEVQSCIIKHASSISATQLPDGSLPFILLVESMSAAWSMMQSRQAVAAVLRSLLAHGEVAGSVALPDILKGGWEEGKQSSADMQDGLGRHTFLF